MISDYAAFNLIYFTLLSKHFRARWSQLQNVSNGGKWAQIKIGPRQSIGRLRSFTEFSVKVRYNLCPCWYGAVKYNLMNIHYKTKGIHDVTTPFKCLMNIVTYKIQREILQPLTVRFQRAFLLRFSRSRMRYLVLQYAMEFVWFSVK